METTGEPSQRVAGRGAEGLEDLDGIVEHARSIAGTRMAVIALIAPALGS